MSQIIKLKRSATPGQVPTTAQLDLGELAINTNDGKMYFKKDDGTPVILEVGGSQSGEASKVSSSGTAPSDPVPAFGDLWFDTTNTVLKYYDGAAWQEVGKELTTIETTGNSTFGDDATSTLTVESTSTFNAPATFNGNATLGDAAADSLTVKATSTFEAPVTTQGNTTLGDASGDTLTVNATSTFEAPVTTKGNTTLGDASGDTLTVNATSTFAGPATFNGGVTIQSGDTFTFDSLAFNNAHKLTISNVSGTTVFGGWVLDTDTNTAN